MSGPPKPIQNIDPNIQAIFNAMAAYMGTTYNLCAATVSIDSMSTTETITVTDPKGNRQSYTSYALGNKVSISPSSAALQAGQTQQFTASVTDPAGNPVAGAQFVWMLNAGALGTVDANGLYSAPATLTAGAIEQLTATVKDAFSSAMVTISLQTNLGRT